MSATKDSAVDTTPKLLVIDNNRLRLTLFCRTMSESMPKKPDDDSHDEDEGDDSFVAFPDSFGGGGVTETDSLLQQHPLIDGLNAHRRGHSDLSFFLGGGNNVKRGHHRRKTSLADFVDGLGTIVEDVKSAAGEVRQSFLGELHDAQEGRTFFLDTAMTRSLSLRPDDLKDFVEETTGRESTNPKPAIPLGPILALLGAVFAVSSHGTVMSLQHAVVPPLKLYWRMSAVAMLLLIVALRTALKEGLPRLNFGQWTTVAVAITCFTVQNLCFVTALTYTTIGNTVILANSQAVLLLLGKLLTGSHVVWMEGIGAIVASTGALICASEEHHKDDNISDSADAFIGGCFALASAFAGVGYLTFAKSARSTMSVTIFTFLMMLGGSFLVLFFMMLVGEKFTWSRDPYSGLFGWMNLRADRLGLEIWIVLVCNVVGTMGFVRSMQYFDSIIIAVATLLEPMLASIIAYAMGAGDLPGLQGWVGNVLVAVGTLAVVYPSIQSGEGASH